MAVSISRAICKQPLGPYGRIPFAGIVSTSRRNLTASTHAGVIQTLSQINSGFTAKAYHAKQGPVVFSQVRCLADGKAVKENVEKRRGDKSETMPNSENLTHFSVGKELSHPKEARESANYTMPHPIWTEEQVQNVKVTHEEPKLFSEKMAYRTVKLFRGGFDLFSGFKTGARTERKWINRICFLETVAGVPGMVAAMLRHMRSLRRMQRDQGWIHTLLEEAENERMHLLTALQLKQPSLFFRMCVIGAQGIFVNLFAVSYVISPKFCHRFVGYLEEEAVVTYTKLLQDIEKGPMQHWKTSAAPEIAINYWKLEPDAVMKDVILAIRADEAHHRLVNHTFASMKEDEFNPHKPGQ